MVTNGLSTESLHCFHLGNLVSYFASGETDFMRCTECGLVLRNPMPTLEQLDRIYADMYETERISHAQTCQESGGFALQRYASSIGRAMRGSTGRVLDFGSGSGALVQLLRESKIDAIGVERSAQARQYCAEQRGFNLFADIDQLEDASVDCVTMIEVIEHLPDPSAALEQLRPKLRPGGRLFLTTPNRRSLRARVEGGYWREAVKKFHVVLFDASSLKRLLVDSGFVAVTRNYFSPVQRAGAMRYILSRAQQTLGLAGSLCFTARRGE